MEMALVSVLLFTLIFGIITFGLLLSFKQDMTRAAAEGARAGAVAIPGSALADADTATEEAVKAFGGSFSTAGCARAGMACIIAEGDCPEDLSLPPANRRRCVTVELVYDYKTEPLFGNLPLISSFLPDEVRSESVARVNE